MQNKTSATVRGVKRVEEDDPIDSHYRMVVSLDWGGFRNVTINRFDNGAVSVNNNAAPKSDIPVKDIRFLVETAINHFESGGKFPLVVANKYSLVGVIE